MNTVIRIMGPSGSGKSMIIKEILRSNLHRSIIETGRVRPIGYEFPNLNLRVLGHYESNIKCHGLDNYSILKAWREIVSLHSKGYNVLFEGDEHRQAPKYTLQIHRVILDDLHVIHLGTSAEACVRSARDRGSLIPENTIVKMHAKSAKDADKLRAAGVRVISTTRSGARQIIRDLLKLETYMEGKKDARHTG